MNFEIFQTDVESKERNMLRKREYVRNVAAMIRDYLVMSARFPLQSICFFSQGPDAPLCGQPAEIEFPVGAGELGFQISHVIQSEGILSRHMVSALVTVRFEGGTATVHVDSSPTESHIVTESYRIEEAVEPGQKVVEAFFRGLALFGRV